MLTKCWRNLLGKGGLVDQKKNAEKSVDDMNGLQAELLDSLESATATGDTVQIYWGIMILYVNV